MIPPETIPLVHPDADLSVVPGPMLTVIQTDLQSRLTVDVVLPSLGTTVCGWECRRDPAAKVQKLVALRPPLQHHDDLGGNTVEGQIVGNRCGNMLNLLIASHGKVLAWDYDPGSDIAECSGDRFADHRLVTDLLITEWSGRKSSGPVPQTMVSGVAQDPVT